MTTGRLLPTDVQSYSRVSMTPVYLAGLLAIFGAAMVGHALVTSVRRRRRDLALLKTLGLTTRQVAAAVAWQASTFAILGVVFGVPAGWPWAVGCGPSSRRRSASLERSSFRFKYSWWCRPLLFWRTLSPLCLVVRRLGRGLPSFSGRSDRWGPSAGAGKPTACQPMNSGFVRRRKS